MPNIQYKPEKSREDDEDYEIVSFEDFCDKSPGSKTDLLTLNDNINYRLCFEGDKTSRFVDNVGEASGASGSHTETSLGGSKNTFKRKMSNSFAPFGKFQGKGGKSPLFSGVIPKPRNDGESPSREHRYERFSERRNVFRRVLECVPTLGSGMLGVAIVCALCIAAWWAVSGAVGGSWGEEHYKKLWERTHSDNVKNLSPMPIEKILTENRYHDHNNLSTKNKNVTETRRKELYKKSGEQTPEALAEACAATTDNMRFDCHPQDGASEQACINRGCCWRSTPTPKAPYCFYPPQYDTFRFLNMSESERGITVFYEKGRSSGYPGDFELARLDVKYFSDDIVQIKIIDALHKRFEPPVPEVAMVGKTLGRPSYKVTVGAYGFRVVRCSDNVTIFNAQDVGGVILSDKFLQLSATLPAAHVFGLGERRGPFKVDMDWNTFAMFNRDRPPQEGLNLYGTHPFYLAVEKDGNSHGTLLLNSNAMDVTVQPSGITYRTTGGVLDLYMMLGAAPADVVARYTEIVGRPFMPPYWALGFHLCKFNYPGGLNGTIKNWQENRDAGIPFDVQWNDIDYMQHSNDFTINNETFAALPAFVDKVHAAGMHYVLMIDVGVGASEPLGTYPPFDRGLEMNVFIKNATNQPFVGKVWNAGNTVFPDFTHPNSSAYWLQLMADFHKRVPYDGAWLDMNEPSNFVDGSVFGSCADEALPYQPRTGDAYLRAHTLCMDAAHYAGAHADCHSLHALTEVQATHFALAEIRGKRPFIISRASSPGLGRLAGHWSGDVASDWHDMRMSIPELLSFSLFGIPMMGADICGFRGNTSLELCQRWTQLGAFYPFARNHNSDSSILQDPVSLGPAMVQTARAALRLRYRLLPYYYTLFWKAHVRGDTVARPLFFEFPSDVSLRGIDSQFLIGPHLLISPILQQGATTTNATLPRARRWYNVRTGALLGSGRRELAEDETVAVGSGAILPCQEPPARGAVSTAVCRSAPLQLLVAPSAARAHGELYWDSGDSLNSYQEKKYSLIEFSLNGTRIKNTINWWGYGVPPLNSISVLDQPPVENVYINGEKCSTPCMFSYNAQIKLLQVNVTLSLDKPFTVSWSYKSVDVHE